MNMLRINETQNLMGCFLYKYHLHLKLSKSRTDDIVASPSIFRGQQVCSCSCALPDCVVVHSFSSRARASSSLAALHCTRPLPGLAWSCCSALCSVKLCCSFSVVWDVQCRGQWSVSSGQRWTLWTAWQWSNPSPAEVGENCVALLQLTHNNMMRS